MFKRVISQVVLLILFSYATYAHVLGDTDRVNEVRNPGYSVSGTVYFEKPGDIHMTVLTREEYIGDKKGKYVITIEVDWKAAEHGSVDFTFGNVTPGRYAMRIYQDVNANGVLDFYFFGPPREPTATYREGGGISGLPPFDDIAFDIRREMTGIEITLRLPGLMKISFPSVLHVTS